MNTYLDCIPCLVRQGLEAARNATDDRRVHEQIVRDVLRMAADMDLDLPPPYLSQAISRRLRELTGVEDPYREARRTFNRLAVEALPELAALVREAPDPLLAAVRCAIGANAIDLGVRGTIPEADVREALRGSPQEPVHGDLEEFRRALVDAREILYLADNAGEIAVDRLLIEEVGPERVTLAVRGAPVLNDATPADAREVGMSDLVEVIDNGSDAPGTILADCSEAFRQRFERADLIIAKGQGNFETLSGTESPVAFLFQVKCPVVARQVGLAVGSHALVYAGGRRPSPRDASDRGRP
jgi:uncharacterized protein with ATP-grasp and redox domains